MQRNADRTRRRILAAATEEFAARGIAGARVNRIAELAGCNKAMLYAYFGSKDGLFDAVYTASVDIYLAEVGFDTADLPGYAGRVFDYFEEHPEHQRLNIWYRLERAEGPRWRRSLPSTRAGSVISTRLSVPASYRRISLPPSCSRCFRRSRPVGPR